MQDDLRLRTFLATGTSGCYEQISEAFPVGLVAAVALLQLGVRRSHRSPQHAVADFVARLDVVGGGSGGFECTQAVAGIFIDLLRQRIIVQPSPLGRRELLDRVGPAVTVMEVEHELHAGFLDAASQHLDRVEVLNDALPPVLGRSILGIHEQAHACRIPSLLLGPGDDVVDDLSVHIIVVRISDAVAQRHALMGLVLGQHRDVAADHRSVIRRLLPTAQDDVDDGIDIGDIHFIVAVHVACSTGIGRQNHLNDGIHVGNVHLAVIIHISFHSSIGTDSYQCQCQT